MKGTVGLNDKQRRFVEEYLVDPNKTQAAIRAGYSPKTAETQGRRLYGNVRIKAEIDRLMAEISERKQVDAEWVVEQLIENYHRSMQAKPVLNSDGEPTGEYTYQGAVANKALELLGKHFGMFVTKVDIRALIEHRGVIALPEIADEDAWLNLSGKTVKELPKAN